MQVSLKHMKIGAAGPGLALFAAKRRLKPEMETRMGTRRAEIFLDEALNR